MTRDDVWDEIVRQAIGLEDDHAGLEFVILQYNLGAWRETNDTAQPFLIAIKEHLQEMANRIDTLLELEKAYEIMSRDAERKVGV